MLSTWAPGMRSWSALTAHGIIPHYGNSGKKGMLAPNTSEPEGRFYTLSPDHTQWLKDADR